MTLEQWQVLQQGRYRIVSRLGAGGMGAVYRAWDTRLNIPVAIKEMVPQPGLDEEMLVHYREQFCQEAKVMARLNHPNLVRVTDFFDMEDKTYLVMDFVEGQSLADHIKQHGAVEESQLLNWTQQLLDALAYCHSQGIIHRDIKPQNVIICPDGRVVLVDFGLVKLWDPNDPRTKTAMRGMGTPEYAPPEQYELHQGHTDAGSDIYSLGATLYHALTGQAPPTATLRIADPTKFAKPRTIVPNVSRKTESVILKALELGRSNRWKSAAEMAAALGLTLQNWGTASLTAKEAEGKPTLVRGHTQQMMRDRKRATLWLWAIPVVILLCGAVGGLAVLGNNLRHQLFPANGPTQTATEEATAIGLTTATSTATATTAASTATPTPTATATATPTPSATPTATNTPTPLPTFLPSPELLSPDDNAGYYTTSQIPLAWEWFRELEKEERFVVVLFSGPEQVYSATVALDDELAFSFRAVDVGLVPGAYTWAVLTQREVAGSWEVIAESVARTLRIISPPTATPTLVPTQPPTQPPPTQEPTQPPPPRPTDTPPPPPTYTPPTIGRLANQPGLPPHVT